jgi:hypothetical protein
VARVAGRVALVSLEQLAIELSEQNVVISPRASAFRSINSPSAEPTLSLERAIDGSWVHSSFWEFDRCHGLTIPVMADYSITNGSVFQYFPVSRRILKVREVSPNSLPAITEATNASCGARILKKSRRPLLNASSWRWSLRGDQQQLTESCMEAPLFCDFLPGTLPLVETIHRALLKHAQHLG